jgi:NAD+ synthase (glutamine-hydrolysing)
MRISLAQINFHVGNFEANTKKILDAIAMAENEQADLVVFSELAICGYPPRDFLEFDDFIRRCEESLETIAARCTHVAAIVGCPSRNTSGRGKDLYNSAFLLEQGKIQEIRHKSLLPNYDVFDEYRYFEPNTIFDIVSVHGVNIALTICEDLWILGTEPRYVQNPMQELAKQHPDLIINIAASPFNFKQEEIRDKVLVTNAVTYNIPLIYVNHVGAQTELLFDGGSLCLDAKGKAITRLASFEEDFVTVEILEENQQASIAGIKQPAPSGDVTEMIKTERIHDALVMGIHDYFGKMGFTKAILGLSGGIDSAVVMVLAARALGPENVLGVLLPTGFSSDHSVTDAKALASNLGCPWELIAIEDSFRGILETLSPQFKDLPFNVAEENIQARIRAVILMALSNKFGHILLNTSNKSEAAVGYGTLYGDMCGGISVIGDVYKTEVYALARFINKDQEIIPENIITKPPSAELRPGQKDSDSLPDYEILDKVLFEYIEMRKGPKELVSSGFDKQMVDRILRLVNTNEYKRHQTPPILRVSGKAFGMGRRMPIVGKYLS